MMHETVQRELFKMLARRLPYSPNPEDLKFTVQVMVDDLKRVGLKDTEETSRRLLIAFGKLGLGDKWPTAKMVVDALPPVQIKSLEHPKDLKDKSNELQTLVGSVTFGKRRRNIFHPGESFGDYKRALWQHQKAGGTEVQFEAIRLHEKGWLSDDEREYRRAGSSCAFMFPDNGETLIRELLKLESDPEARAERDAIQNETPA